MPPAMLADPALAPAGRSKIEYAATRMPVLAQLTEELARTRPLAGERVAACLHVTTETANLCRALTRAGAEVAVCASNPLSTKDDVAAAIHAEGAHVYAIRGCDRDAFYRQVHGALSIRPTIVVDDGSDLTATLHTGRRELLDTVRGAAEVTSVGVARARNMAADGALTYPLFAVNDAVTKHLFDNRYGTGQSTVDGILRGLNMLLAGKVFVVVGFGWCGRGVALRARGMGARVVVVEVDPVRALEAVMEGLEVMPMAEAAAVGDVFVTVTGNRDAITYEHMRAMKPGAVLANNGHFDLEIDVAGLKRAARSAVEVRPGAVSYTLHEGHNVIVLGDGRLVGQALAEASPAEIMDLTFATMTLTVTHVAGDGGVLPPGVHPVPLHIAEEVARRKLSAVGVRIDTLSDAQRSYLSTWREGT